MMYKIVDIILFIKNNLRIIQIGDVVYFGIDWPELNYRTESKYKVVDIRDKECFLELQAINTRNKIFYKEQIINSGDNIWLLTEDLSLKPKLNW